MPNLKKTYRARVFHQEWPDVELALAALARTGAGLGLGSGLLVGLGSRDSSAVNRTQMLVLHAYTGHTGTRVRKTCVHGMSLRSSPAARASHSPEQQAKVGGLPRADESFLPDFPSASHPLLASAPEYGVRVRNMPAPAGSQRDFDICARAPQRSTHSRCHDASPTKPPHTSMHQQPAHCLYRSSWVLPGVGKPGCSSSYDLCTGLGLIHGSFIMSRRAKDAVPRYGPASGP